MNQDIQVRNNEAQREARKRDKLERDLTQTKSELDGKNSDIRNMQTQIDRYKQEKDKLDQQLREQRVSILNDMSKYILNYFWYINFLCMLETINTIYLKHITKIRI